jgi:hypothetical protein
MTNEPQKELTPLVNQPAEMVPAIASETHAPEVPVAPSVEVQPDQMPTSEGEGIPIHKESFMEDTIDSLKHSLRLSKKPKHITLPIVRDEVTKQVEHLMQEGLEDAYKELTPTQQQEFKIKGEETARNIRELLRAAHVKVKKIFKLIFEWLKLLPGINKFFLEQEAKIKADRILALKQRERN